MSQDKASEGFRLGSKYVRCKTTDSDLCLEFLDSVRIVLCI